MTFEVQPHPGRRPFAVVRSDGWVDSLHADRDAATLAARRANGQCVVCGGVFHTPGCPLAVFERDTTFGSDYDDSDGEHE